MYPANGIRIWARPLLASAMILCVYLCISSVKADTFHGMNAGAVVWNGSTLLTEAKANAIAATGTHTIRINFRIDWQDGHTGWDSDLLAQYDQVIANATNAGLEVLGLWSNETVYANQATWNDDPSGTGMNAYVGMFAQNALLLADRYKDTIKTWEVTNEPNAWAVADPAYSDPKTVGGTYILPSVYANILAETYKELNYYDSRSILDDNGIRLMTGGLLAHDIGGGFSTAMPYMQQVYNQDHVWDDFQSDTGRDYAWDLFGYHFYISQGSLLAETQLNNYFNAVRNTQAANGDSSDISVTEWGWQTVSTNTQELQRDNMATGYDVMESKSYIESTYWYQWVDEPAGNWGVNVTEGSPKLSYYEFTDRNTADPELPGDFDLDGFLDADDIDLLFANLGDPSYDLTDDGNADTFDVRYLVRTLMNTEYGDADLDGDVDIQDYNLFALGYGDSGGWASGDFSGNGLVNDSDLTILKIFFGFEATTPSLTIPEPASIVILAPITLLASRSRRH